MIYQDTLSTISTRSCLVRTPNGANNKASNMGDARKIIFSDNLDFQRKFMSKIQRELRYVQSSALFHVDRSRSENVDELKRGNLDTFAELLLLSRASCIVGSHSGLSALAGSIQRVTCFSYFKLCEQTDYDMWREDGLTTAVEEQRAPWRPSWRPIIQMLTTFTFLSIDLLWR